ncbi:MAG: hypothetical protein HeimC2_00850 [Candidatus Heimdallarchaeota archaeon LC_2]|nr:MAG: hypothetical protein HeimC2_00850 [Candidatus Heimdallarchaeota archaeon LC_2]
MQPEDYHNKINNNSDELELNDHENDDDDLSLDLLFNALDGLFLDYQPDQPDQRPEVNNQTNSSIHSPSIVPLLKQMYKLTTWGNVEEGTGDRPKLCLICHSLICDHVKNLKSKLNIEDLLENAINQCQHEISEEWVFEEVCAKCIINSCEQVNSISSPDLFVLWDEVDLTQYLQWIQKIDKEASFTN